MKVKINKPCRVNLLSGEVEVTKEEADRLFLLGLALTLTACDAPVDFPDDDTGVSVTTIKNSEGDTALTNSQTVIDPASLRDNTPVCLETSAPGLLVDGNAYASVDYSNTKEGYIIVDYFGSSPKVKLQITGPNGVTYTYDIQTGYAAFPLTSGAGDYEISVCENIEGTSYSLAFKTTINAPEVSTFGPYLYPNQYVYFDKNCKTVAKGAELASNCTNDLDVVTNVYNYITKHITYDYDMERKPQHYKAEEWITDKYCVNKKHTKLYPISGKFRRKTIDRKDFIFNKFESLLK